MAGVLTMAAEPTKDESTESRIILSCGGCTAAINIPNKGLGRAVAAAWRTRHEGEGATHDDTN